MKRELCCAESHLRRRIKADIVKIFTQDFGNFPSKVLKFMRESNPCPRSITTVNLYHCFAKSMFYACHKWNRFRKLCQTIDAPLVLVHQFIIYDWWMHCNYFYRCRFVSVCVWDSCDAPADSGGVRGREKVRVKPNNCFSNGEFAGAWHGSSAIITIIRWEIGMS